MAHHKSSSNHLPTIIYVVNLLEEMKLSSYLSHNYHQMYPLKTNMKIGKSRRVLIGNTSTHSWWIFQVSDVSELGWCGVSNLLSRRLAVAGFSFHGVNFTSIHPLGFYWISGKDQTKLLETKIYRYTDMIWVWPLPRIPVANKGL